MDVALFYLPDVKYGGWPTYTAHLYYGLKAAGHTPRLFKIGNRTENKVRDWGRGISYQNLSLQDATDVANSMESIITATNKKYEAETEALVTAGAMVVIHDPTELKGEIPNIIKQAKDVLTIRPINKQSLREKGIDARYLPHPYMRSPRTYPHRMAWAASFSRVDWDKGTHHIIEANEKLEPRYQIDIYGACNTMYAYHKLPENWKDWYKGTFPADNLWAGVKIASRYKWAVDMSTISGDGGGTQYTFLEAADAGTALLLNKGWLTGRADDKVLNYAHFTEPENLAEALRELPTVDPSGLLDEHDAATIAARTIDHSYDRE
jgi:hypothetical protein